MSHRLFSVLAMLVTAWFDPRAGAGAETALPQAVYIWQRAWTEPLRVALA